MMFLQPITKNHTVDSFFEGMFNEFFGNSSNINSNYSLKSKIVENDDKMIYKLAVPGIEKEKVEIDIDNYSLKVKYKNNKKEHDFKSFEEWSSSWNVPRNLDTNKVSAKYEDGILSIEIPKQESAKPKKIMIE